VQLSSITTSPTNALRIPVSSPTCINYMKDTWYSEANVRNLICLPCETDTHGDRISDATYSGIPFECNMITCDCGAQDCPKLLAIVASIFFCGNTLVSFFDLLKGLYLPYCGKTVCWGRHPLESFHNTDFKGHINCPLCGMLDLASQRAFSLLQETCHTNPSLPLPVKKTKVFTTPRTSCMGTRSRSSAEKEKTSVTYPPTPTSPHSHSFSALIHNTHDMYTSHPKFLGIL